MSCPKLLLTHAVDRHPRLLLNRFDRRKSQMWPLHGFANGCPVFHQVDTA